MTANHPDIFSAYREMHDAWFALSRADRIDIAREYPERIVDFIDAILSEETILNGVRP